VLENDGEYQRWKIERRNALRTDRDRKAQELTRVELEKMRNKAVAGLGPQQEVQLASAEPMVPSSIAPAPTANPPSPGASSPAQSSAPRRNQSFDFGSGPVGPLFVGLLLLLRRLRNKRA
jgi:hypothetical protein